MRLRNVITLSLRHRRYARVIAIICSWCFFAGCSSGSLNYYLLNTAGISYTYIGLIDALYMVFLYIFSGYWQRYIKKHSWLKTFAYTGIAYAPTMLPYAFVTGTNYLWLMTAVRLVQHAIGVGMNMAYANLPFVNLPEEDRTNYISFHGITTNLATLLGILFGTAFIAALGDDGTAAAGIRLTSPQLLMIIQGAGQTLTAASVIIFYNRISSTPDNAVSPLP